MSILIYRVLIFSSFTVISAKCENTDVIKYNAANKSLMHDTKHGLHFAKFVQLQNVYLRVAPIKVVHVATLKDCLLSCVANLKCASLNFAKSSSANKQHPCELLATDMYRNPTNLTNNTNFYHFVIQVRPNRGV